MKSIDEAMNKIRAVIEEYSEGGARQEPVKPREYWIRETMLNGKQAFLSRNDADNFGIGAIIHVVELLPGYRIVNREMLAKAWDETRLEYKGWFSQPSIAIEASFSYFCRVLGLGDV